MLKCMHISCFFRQPCGASGALLRYCTVPSAALAFVPLTVFVLVRLSRAGLGIYPDLEA